MIIDRVDLAGDSAYFRTAAGAVNLANGQGSIAAAGEGLALNVVAIHLYFEKSDLSGLWKKQAGPLVTVEVSKEMFPKLLTDPYSSRVHTIGGFDDFRRGVSSNCRSPPHRPRPSPATARSCAARRSAPQRVARDH